MNSSKYSWSNNLGRNGMAGRPLAKLISKKWASPFPEQDVIIKRLFLSLCSDVRSPLAVGFMLIAKHNPDWVDIVGDHFVDPLLYNDPITYKKDAQMVGFVKKLPGQSSVSRQNALKSFIAAEHQCAFTNNRISRRDHLCDPTLASVLYRAKAIIADILGDVPDVCDLDFQFGPGATFSVSTHTDSIDKLSSCLELTPDLRQAGTKYLTSCPGWWKMHLESPKRLPECVTIIPGDRLATVPKTRKTDRPIAIGPTVNLLIQKGYGRVLRDRFRKHVNLDRAQDRHRRLAMLGSKNRSIATIDLSSASDTISFMFVKDMLPQSWFNALFECRSPRYLVEGKWYAYSKFSAMGNGYTFELESILFYALALASVQEKSCAGPVSVFGDDIIVPIECYNLTVRALENVGFSVNERKSFHTGFFRESCGGDYYDGIYVRPFSLKNDVCFQSLFLMSRWLQDGDKFLYPRLWKKIRGYLGKDVISLFSGRYDLDGCLYDATVTYPPRYVVLTSPRFAKRSKPTWNRAEYAFCLYRQMHLIPHQFLHNQTLVYQGRIVDKKRMKVVPGTYFQAWL